MNDHEPMTTVVVDVNALDWTSAYSCSRIMKKAVHVLLYSYLTPVNFYSEERLSQYENEDEKKTSEWYM